MAESADASDLKSDDGDIVWVRPPLALLVSIKPGLMLRFFAFSRQVGFPAGGAAVPGCIDDAV